MRLGNRLRNWWGGSLQRRLLLSNVGTTLFFLFVLGLVALLVGPAHLRRQVGNGHKQLAVLVAKDISAQYGSTVETVGLLRRRLEVAADSPSAQARAMVDLRLASPLTYRALYLFDATGDPLVSVAGPVEELAARPIEETIALPLAQVPDGVLDVCRQTGQRGMFTAPVQIVGADRVPVLYLRVPLAGGDGQVLVVEVDLRSVWQRVDEVYAGQTGRALVVSRDGVIIAHPDRAYIGQPLPPPLRPVLDGYEGEATYTDPLGGRVMLSAYSPVGKQSGWGIVVEQEYAQALAPLSTIARATFGILLVVAVMATVVTILIGRGIVRPLQTLEAATQAITRTGKIDRRVAVGRRDEVGRLADAFDRMLASLRERERWYQTLAEHAPVGILQAGSDGNWQYVNPRLTEITGLTSEAAQDAGWLAALLPEDRDVIADAWSAFVAGQAPYHTTYRFQHPDGVVRWVIGRATPARDAEGALLGFTGTLTDITEHKQAEEKAQRLLDRQVIVNRLALALGATTDLDAIYDTIYQHIRELMDSEAFIVSFYDSETHLIRAGYVVSSEGVRDVASFPPIRLEEESHGTQSQVIRTGEPLYISDYRQAMVRTRTEYTIEKNGAVVKGPPPPDDQEESTNSALYVPMKIEGKTIGVIQTQSHQPNAYDQEDIDLLSALANVAAVAIQNARLYDVVQQELAVRVQAEKALREHRERLEETVAERTAELNARMTEVERLNLALTNMLEDLQAVNRDLEATSARLEEVNQELDGFAYVISHDLRAPLRGISQLATWIVDDYTDTLDDEGRRKLHLLTDRVKRMHALIDGVLHYSRVGRSREQACPVDLNQLVPDVIESLAPPTHICVSIEDELPVVVAEPTRWTQVFQNLVDNGIKFMDKSAGRVTIGCTDEGTHWQFSVSDNGPGIEPRHYDRIFRLFQTLVPQEGSASTGVGLALVKRIVETSGGQVWVESTVGEGSTFYFTLRKSEGE